MKSLEEENAELRAEIARLKSELEPFLIARKKRADAVRARMARQGKEVVTANAKKAALARIAKQKSEKKG